MVIFSVRTLKAYPILAGGHTVMTKRKTRNGLQRRCERILPTLQVNHRNANAGGACAIGRTKPIPWAFRLAA